MNTPTRGADEYNYNIQREIIKLKLNIRGMVEEREFSLHSRDIIDIIFQVTVEFWSISGIPDKGTT